MGVHGHAVALFYFFGRNARAGILGKPREAKIGLVGEDITVSEE